MNMRRFLSPIQVLLVLCCFSSTAAGQLPEKVVIDLGHQSSLSLHRSAGVLVENTLYLSGQSGELDDGTFPSSISEEITQSFRNVERVLQAAGMSLQDVISCYVFLLDMDHYETLNTIFREVFPEKPPVRSTMGIGRLPGKARIVVETIAVQQGAPRE
ncbi:MAG TPA: RidA family protein [Acidobacteriota bacterium]|nr:RidA family protein [Acidobacteriota bacterium]